jgi:hypothetical protein
MEMASKNKELPLLVQFGALISLWSIWLLTVVLVIWNEWTMRPLEMYADPFWIYSLLFAAFPLVLVALGGMFLLHAPTEDILGHRMLRWFVIVVNCFGLVVFLTCGTVSTFALFFARQVRE